MKLEHLAFNVPEPEKMADWYQAHLGLRLAKITPTPTFQAYFLVDDDSTLLEFYRNPIAEPMAFANIHPANLHVAFYADDLERTVESLLAAGATQIGEKITFPSGAAYYYVRDPWGLALQIINRPEPLLNH